MTEQKSPQELAYEARQKALNRTNRLTIYLPLTLLALMVLAATGGMLWLVLANEGSGTAEWREFASASADLIIILTTLPLILLMTFFPILAIGWIWYTWDNRYPVEKWVQRLLRKTDTFLVNNSDRVKTVTKSTANASIVYRSSLTRFGRILEQLFRWLFPSALNEKKKEDFYE